MMLKDDKIPSYDVTSEHLLLRHLKCSYIKNDLICIRWISKTWKVSGTYYNQTEFKNWKHGSKNAQEGTIMILKWLHGNSQHRRPSKFQSLYLIPTLQAFLSTWQRLLMNKILYLFIDIVHSQQWHVSWLYASHHAKVIIWLDLPTHTEKLLIFHR